MKKLNRRSFILLFTVAFMLIVISTLSLKGGLAFANKLEVDQMPVSKDEPTTEVQKNYSAEHYELTKQELITQSKYGVTVAPPTIAEFNDYLEEVSKRWIHETVDEQDKIKQTELYQSVKDKVNIQQEDAKELFSKGITNLFSDSISPLEIGIYFSDFLGLGKYKWQLAFVSEENKKLYQGELDAMTGELTAIAKYDYTGLDIPEYSGLISKYDAGALKTDKSALYKDKIEEIFKNIKLLSSSKINDIHLVKTQYIGLRPMAELKVVMEDGKTGRIAFYTDTDELISVNLWQFNAEGSVVQP